MQPLLCFRPSDAGLHDPAVRRLCRVPRCAIRIGIQRQPQTGQPRIKRRDPLVRMLIGPPPSHVPTRAALGIVRPPERTHDAGN